MSWNYIDGLLILIVLLSILLGWYRGFIYGLLDLLRWIGSLFLALRFYQWLAHLLAQYFDWKEIWIQPFAFILIFILTGALIQLLGHMLLRRLPEGTHERGLNRFLGMLPGFVNGLILAAIVSSLLLALPFADGLHNATRESPLANRLAASTERFETALTSIFGEAIRQTLNTLTVRPESDERVELPYKVGDTRPRPDLEAQMLEMVNRERAEAGLKPLAADPPMTEVARRHSADMFARGYFSHVTPEGRSPFDRINAASIAYRTAGENLALAPTLSIAHNGLMNSPGHRANILRPEFGRLGIGIMDGGRRGIMVTQNFRN
jgi:uncharacterized protein YkwD